MPFILSLKSSFNRSEQNVQTANETEHLINNLYRENYKHLFENKIIDGYTVYDIMWCLNN